MRSYLSRFPEAMAMITVFNLAFVVPTLASNLITNGSFEEGNFTGTGVDPTFTRIAPSSSDLTGWTVGGSGVDWHNSDVMNSPIEGEFVLDLNLDGASSGTL
ncbi:MAG: hypothetical protein QNJ37_22100 [Crocosphaera sp.]|nr:hypothetical protein [Crocosphaera sp.]